MGQPRFPEATRLLITADAGGSNGYRVRAWKVELAKLADRDRSRDHSLPLPAGNLEVEQDRTPHVQLHLDELAGPAAHLVPHHRRADPATTTDEGLRIRADDDPNCTTRPASRSPTPSSRRCRSRATTFTATGTTPSPR